MGLSGHAFGSWKHRQGTFMWLRDHLPSCIPGAQVLLYGYDSTLVWSQSFQKIDDIARRFCEEIREMQSLRVGRVAGSAKSSDADGSRKRPDGSNRPSSSSHTV